MKYRTLKWRRGWYLGKIYVWPVGLAASPDIHEIKRPMGAENFLRRSLSMSKRMAKPHHWKHILPHHITPGSELSWAAVFPMADSDTDSERCQTTTFGWPNPAPCNWSLTFIPLWMCMCESGICVTCVYACIWMPSVRECAETNLSPAWLP